MAVNLRLDADGNVEGVRWEIARGVAKPVAKWGHLEGCQDEDGFGSYPEDGKCPCGMYKHHVHCTCGGIVQVG